MSEVTIKQQFKGDHAKKTKSGHGQNGRANNEQTCDSDKGVSVQSSGDEVEEYCSNADDFIRRLTARRKDRIGDLDEEWEKIYDRAIKAQPLPKKILLRYQGFIEVNNTLSSWYQYSESCKKTRVEEQTRAATKRLIFQVAGAVVLLLAIPILLHRIGPPCHNLQAQWGAGAGAACRAAAAPAASLTKGMEAGLHVLVNALLPLPAQPGTEQYWDVRWRRLLRQFLAPFTLSSTPTSSLLLAPCRMLPLQHYCNLTSVWASSRIRWHLDAVQQVLQLERLGEFGADGKCRSETCRAGGGKNRAYDRLCQQQFGAGAAFDGEMCACRDGFQVREGVCRRMTAASAASSPPGGGGRKRRETARAPPGGGGRPEGKGARKKPASVASSRAKKAAAPPAAQPPPPPPQDQPSPPPPREEAAEAASGERRRRRRPSRRSAESRGAQAAAGGEGAGDQPTAGGGGQPARPSRTRDE